MSKRHGARHKLNGAHVVGALVVAGMVAALSGSGMAFAVTLGGLLVAGLVAGDIRP